MRRGIGRETLPVLAPLALAGLLSLAGCAPGADRPGAASDDRTVTVLAAASLTDVFEAVAADVEADHEGVTVEQSFAASSTIVQQVNEGAPADVIALAGLPALEPLEDAHRVGPVEEFATNDLQLVVPADNPAEVTGVDALTEPGVRLVVCAEQVPCGTAARALFEALDIEPDIASFEPDVRATLTKVELGEADVGLVYRTDVTAAGDRVLGIDIPDDVNVVTTYPILAVSDDPLATVFVDEVLSERGRAHLTAAGFGSPP